MALAWHGVAGPHLFDTGELVAAAWTLGGSHAPGQPLYSVLGHAAMLLPIGPLEWRASVLSAAGAVAAAWCAGRLAGMMVEAWSRHRGPLERFTPDAVALATLLSPPLLRQATRPEVYAPTLALALAAILCLWRWASDGGRARAHLRRAALLAGLVTALHPPHALALVAAGIVLLALHDARLLRRPGALAGVVSFGVLGLAAHLLLPVRAAAGAPMWGDPTSLAGFFDYVSARAYRMNLGGEELGTGRGAAQVLWYAARATGPVPLLGLLLLAGLAARTPPGATRRAMLGAMAIVPVTMLAAALQPLEERNPDNVAYFALPVALAVAAGAVGLLLFLRARASRSATVAAAALLAALAVHPTALARAPAAVRADAPALHALGALLTQAPPPRALTIVETDFVATTWWAARATEGARPDVALFATGLATSSWHWRTLEAHPAFDGVPVRGPGSDARSALVRGAVLRAQEAGAPIASEPDAPVEARGEVSGPYLLASLATEPPPPQRRSMAERLAPHLDREIARSRDGDHGAVGNVLRHHQVARVRRLLQRGHFAEGFPSLARALHFAPPHLRTAVRSARGPWKAPVPPAVKAPDAYLTARGDLVRQAACWLFAAGSAHTALALLEWQAEQGDPRALLQLAWVHTAGGHGDGARASLDAFVQAAPALAVEADTLRTHLEAGGSP
jgi:hypothetical protein